MKEVQNMALGMLMVLFVVMSVLGAIGILIMFLSKKSRLQSGAVYVMAAFGLLTAYLGANSLPSNYLSAQLFRWAIGAVGIAGALLYWKSSEESWKLAGRLLVAGSVVLGIAKLFLL